MSHFIKKWQVYLIVSLVLALSTSSLFAQNKTGSKNKKREEVFVEEVWKGYSWTNNMRRTLTYDSADNCVSELTEQWTGSRWEKMSLMQMTYDALHYKTAWFKYDRKSNSAGWELVEGYRSMVDTVKGKSNRVVLYDVEWNPAQKMWVASDSIFYDKNDRITKTVNRKTVYSDTSNDSVLVITTVENVYQTNNSWVETNKTWRSDGKKTESERYRYRKMSGSSPLQVFTIDYWDNDMNRWILNTARLHRKMEGNQIVSDSLEEYIDDKLIPVYVSSEIRDSNGLILQHRSWQKSMDEETKKWTGSYVKWERSLNPQMKNFTVAESVFVTDDNGNGWKLTNYENKICKIPSAGDITESGDYEDLSNIWQYERYFDTLSTSGVFINGEYYYDEIKKKWLPTLKCSVNKEADSIKIKTELLDMGKNEWVNDSLFVVRTDSEGKMVSRINYVWSRSGLLSGDWVKANRITVVR